MCSTLACALVRSATSRSGLDFAALAMVLGYDGAGRTVKAYGNLVPRTQRSASLAMRSIVQCSGALLSRGPWGGILGPGSRYARPGHENLSRRRLEQPVRRRPRLGRDLGARQ